MAPTVRAFMRTALIGRITDPVISHSTRIVVSTSNAIASGSDAAIAAFVSPNSAGSPPMAAAPGAATARTSATSACVASLPTESREATSTCQVPPPRYCGAATRSAPGSARRLAAYAASRGAAEAGAWTAATTGVAVRPPVSAATASATTRALWVRESVLSSADFHAAPRAGNVAAIISPAVTAATMPGRRIVQCEMRYHRPSVSGRSCLALAASLDPHRARNAGVSVSATPAATSATAAPPIPIDFRKFSGKTTSDAIAAATVSELKTIVRPAACIVATTASRPGPRAAISSRNRETRNSE